MGAFPDKLWAEPQDRKTWKIVGRPFRYYCDNGRLVSVPIGFITDFASVPKILNNIYPPWGSYGWAAVIHDYLYTLQPVTKREADEIFYEAMRSSGVPFLRRWIIKNAVALFGFVAWNGHKRELEKQRKENYEKNNVSSNFAADLSHTSWLRKSAGSEKRHHLGPE